MTTHEHQHDEAERPCDKPRSAYEWNADVHATYPPLSPSFIREGDDKPLGPGGPGHAEVHVREVILGDPAAEGVMSDGATVTLGVPLGYLREELGGDEGDWIHPATGKTVRISLKEWAGRDPDTTLLQLQFIVKPQEPMKQ